MFLENDFDVRKRADPHMKTEAKSAIEAELPGIPNQEEKEADNQEEQLSPEFSADQNCQETRRPRRNIRLPEGYGERVDGEEIEDIDWLMNSHL